VTSLPIPKGKPPTFVWIKSVTNTKEALNAEEVAGRDGDPIVDNIVDTKGPVTISGTDAMMEGTHLMELLDNAFIGSLP
jgi:hypothetical protein